MHHLFLSPEQISGDAALILGPDHLHLTRVLRARPGEALTLLDNLGNAYRAVIVTIGKAETTARIEGRAKTLPEPPVFLTVAQALGKGDKFEQVLQHGTEAGASAFVPVRAERCVVDIPAARVADRVARWRQIAKGAAEQCRRARLPEVVAPVLFAELLQKEMAGLVLHPAEDAVPLARVLRDLPTLPKRLLLAIGPEGGWSPAEVSAARTANLLPVTLGPRTLRTETAALIAISQILYHYENSG